jgi:hypothetical protein
MRDKTLRSIPMPSAAFLPTRGLALAASLLALLLAQGGATRAQTPIPAGFADSVVLTGLQMPTG